MWASDSKDQDNVAAVVASWKRPAASGKSGGRVAADDSNPAKNRKCQPVATAVKKSPHQDVPIKPFAPPVVQPPVVRLPKPDLPPLVIHDSDSDDDEDGSRLAYHRLALYLGGSSMSQSAFEVRFGRVTNHHPFGKHVWDGLVHCYPEYCRVVGKDWCRQMNLWLGAFAMPENFSKAVAREPAPVGKRHAELVVASKDLYPAVSLLDAAQDKLALAALSTVDDGLAILCTKAGGAALGLGSRGSGGEPDAEPPATDGCQKSVDRAPGKSSVRFLRVDQRWLGNVYMVCLKIMIAGSRPWEVNFDRVHLYSRL